MIKIKNGMQGMSVINKTKILWGISLKVPKVLRSADQLNAPRQKKQSGINACGNIQDSKLTKQNRNYSRIEITGTSYYEKGWE